MSRKSIVGFCSVAIPSYDPVIRQGKQDRPACGRRVRFEFPPPKAGGTALFKSSRLKTVQTKKSELFLVPGRGLEPPRP